MLRDFARLPALLLVSFHALALSIAALLGWAFVGLGAVLACLALSPWLGPLVLGPMAVMFVAAHALYAIYASRRIARAIDPGLVEPIAPGHWVGATVGISVVTVAIALPFAVGLPNLFMSVIVLAVALACTPLLPELALKPGDLGAALTDAGRYPLRFVPLAALVALPYLALAELIGWNVIRGHASFGLFEGGLIALPLLGAHTFIATTSAALVSTVIYAELRGQRFKHGSWPRAIAVLALVLVACAGAGYWATRPPDESNFTMLGTWTSNDGFTITLKPDRRYTFCDGGACSDGTYIPPDGPHGFSVVLTGLFDKPNSKRFLGEIQSLGGLWGAHGNIADFEFAVNSGLGSAAPAERCDDKPCVFFGDYESGPYLAFTKDE